MQNEIITLYCSVFITLFISYKSFISFYWMCCLAVIFIINLLTILLFITIYNVVAKFHSPMIFRNDIFLLATIIMGLRIIHSIPPFLVPNKAHFHINCSLCIKYVSQASILARRRGLSINSDFTFDKNLATCYYFFGRYRKRWEIPNHV